MLLVAEKHVENFLASSEGDLRSRKRLHEIEIPMKMVINYKAQVCKTNFPPYLKITKHLYYYESKNIYN